MLDENLSSKEFLFSGTMKVSLLTDSSIQLAKVIQGDNGYVEVETGALPRPGLYFERLKNLKFTHTIWTMVIMLDIEFPAFHLTKYEETSEKLSNVSRGLIYYQDTYLPLRNELREAKNLLEHLKILLQDLIPALPIEKEEINDSEAVGLEHRRNRIVLNMTRNSVIINSTLMGIEKNIFDEDGNLQKNITTLLDYWKDEISPGEYYYKLLYGPTVVAMREKLAGLLR